MTTRPAFDPLVDDAAHHGCKLRLRGAGGYSPELVCDVADHHRRGLLDAVRPLDVLDELERLGVLPPSEKAAAELILARDWNIRRAGYRPPRRRRGLLR